MMDKTMPDTIKQADGMLIVDSGLPCQVTIKNKWIRFVQWDRVKEICLN